MTRARSLYLICYDIADPRRLAQVARCLTRAAARVQYSVFVGDFSELELDVLLRELDDIIDAREDDIRAYPLPERGEVAVLGRQIFPEDILLLRNGHNLLRLGSAGHRPRRPSAR